MIKQEYYYQDASVYQKGRLTAAMHQWEGGALDAFTSAVEEIHSQYTILGWLIDEAKESFLEDDTPILKEDWNKNHYLYREDVPWKDDLTVGVAEVRRDRSDRLNELAFRRANVDFWSLPNLSGSLLGAMGSPENLVAWGGMIGRAGSLAKLGTKVPMTTNYLNKVRHLPSGGSIGRGMTDAFVADSLFQTVKATVQANRGEDPDLIHAAFELGIATMTGGVIGTFPMAYQVATKIPSAFRPAIIKKTMKDFKDGPANYFKSRARRHTEEELNPEAKVDELNERLSNIEDTEVKLTEDASTAAGAENIQIIKGGFRNIIHKAANCIRRMGG